MISTPIEATEEFQKRFPSEVVRYRFEGPSQPPYEQTVERLKNAIVNQGISTLEGEWSWFVENNCVRILWKEEHWFGIIFIGTSDIYQGYADHVVQMYVEGEKYPMSNINITEREFTKQIRALRRWLSRKLEGINNNNPL